MNGTVEGQALDFYYYNDMHFHPNSNSSIPINAMPYSYIPSNGPMNNANNANGSNNSNNGNNNKSANNNNGNMPMNMDMQYVFLPLFSVISFLVSNELDGLPSKPIVCAQTM